MMYASELKLVSKLHHENTIPDGRLTCNRKAVRRSAVVDMAKGSSPSSLLLFNIANASSALLDL